MGYDTERFTCTVDEELICSMCHAVLEDPLQAPACEHAFCAACIRGWLNDHQTCPLDRRSLTPHQLEQVPRIVKNLLSKLTIKCKNDAFGCEAVVTLDQLQSHLSQCERNPKRPVNCEKGCGLVVPFDELPQHYCNLIQNQNFKQAQLQAQIDDQRQQLDEQKREIQALKDMIRAMRVIDLPQSVEMGQEANALKS